MRRCAGFTLVELLVALAVFAVVATTAYTRSGDTMAQLQQLEQRTMANWIAENELAVLRASRVDRNDPIPTGRQSETQLMAGRTWRIETEVSSTTHPWLRRVEISVAPDQGDASERYGSRLIGFVGRH